MRRSRSLVNNTGGGTDFTVRSGVSNLGPDITLRSYGLSGSNQQSRSATFSAAVLGVFEPQASSVAAGFAIIWALAWRR